MKQSVNVFTYNGINANDYSDVRCFDVYNVMFFCNKNAQDECRCQL